MPTLKGSNRMYFLSLTELAECTETLEFWPESLRGGFWLNANGFPLGLINPLTVVVYFKAPLQRLIVLADFGYLSRFERDQKISQRKKYISVISAGSSEAGERYQKSLPFPHGKAVTISIAERCKLNDGIAILFN